MNYELVIQCSECQVTHSWGGFSKLPALSDAEVFEKAKANPGCYVTQENLKVERSQQTENNVTVVTYTLSAVLPEPPMA